MQTQSLDSLVGLFLGVLFIVVITLGAAIGVLFLLSPYPMASRHPLLVSAILAPGLGVFSGFWSRWLLRRHLMILRWLVGVTGWIAGMAVIGILTEGMAGLYLFRDNSITPDWSGLCLIIIGMITTWLALRAWNTGRQQVIQRYEPQYEPKYVTPAPASPRPVRHIKSKNKPGALATVLSAGATALRSPLGRSRPAAKLPRRKGGGNLPKSRSSLKVGGDHPLNLGNGKAVSGVPHLSRWTAKSRPKPVQLTGEEERRCPYCLEPVLPNDPRGDVVCSICHAHHHADCWEITGMCQVPHQQVL